MNRDFNQIQISLGVSSGLNLFTHPQLQYKNMIEFEESSDSKVSLALSPSTINLKKGSYSSEVCVSLPSSSPNWRKNVELSLNDPNGLFKFSPKVGRAYLGGTEKICGHLGTAGTVTETNYYTRLELKELASADLGAYKSQAIYNPLPFFKLKVVGTKSVVDVPSSIICLNGGSSIPIIVKPETAPFKSLIVSLKLTAKNSVGLNLTSESTVTLTPGVPNGFLKFKCLKDTAETGG